MAEAVLLSLISAPAQNLLVSVCNCNIPSTPAGVINQITPAADPENSQVLLQQEINRHRDARYDHRLHSVSLVAAGMPCEQVAVLFGDSPRSVANWVRRFDRQGLAGLAEGNHSGRPGPLSVEQMEEVRGLLRQPPHQAGWKVNFWDGKTLAQCLRERYQIPLGVRQCQRLFHQLDLRYRLPRPAVGKANPQKQAEHKKNSKALQNHEMFAAQKFVENVYYHELTRELVKFGYQIKNKPRGDFEIQGVAPELIEKFSKRHQEIDQKTKELLAREPEKADGSIATIRENIAHKERPRKIRDIGLEKLQTLWDDQMTAGEKDSLNNLTVSKTPVPGSVESICEQAVAWAEQHLFERCSIVPEYELWRHALERARGQDVSLADIQAITQKRGYVRFEHHPGKVSTREHLMREWEIIQTVKEGMGECYPLVWKPKPFDSKLDDEQREALAQLVSNIHRVAVFRGGAGTGKSFVLRELVGQIRDGGRGVVVLAPQRQQVLDMERDGFPSPTTVASFLHRKELKEGAVVIVDEASQIGGNTMLELLRLVVERNARLILSGDTRQHGAVEAGDALLAIEKHSGIRPVELTNIRRQNPALAKSIEERQRIKEYRQAVEEARDGKFSESFERLDKLKTIEPCTLADKHEKLTARYLELVKDHQSAVVVSQSWNEIHQVNDAIRAALKRDKLIGESETTVTTFQPVDLTNAQKRDARSYAPDTVLVFNRDVRGFKAGESARLKMITYTHLMVETDTRIAPISFKHLDKLTACQRKELALASGDKLQIKTNGRSVENRKLVNGELVTVKAVEPDGRIALVDGRVLDKNFRQFVRGYAITSYASQGKSVDYVLFSDSAAKAATSQQQWYVTISRGKKGIHIFTSDKEQLQENITRSGDRPSIMDLLAARYQNDPIYRLIEERWGQRTAVIMTNSRRAREFREMRQRQIQRQAQSQTQTETLQTQSHGVSV